MLKMLLAEKAQIAAILFGLMLALAGGAASSITYSHPQYKPQECSEIKIAASGAITCTQGPPTKFTIPSPLLPCYGLAISAAGAVSCATTIPQGCVLTASPVTDGKITLTAGKCTPNPSSYSWTDIGLGVNPITTQNNQYIATLPENAGPYPYSVTPINAAGAGEIAELIVNVGKEGYKGPYAYIAHTVGAVDDANAVGTLSVVDTTTNSVVTLVPVQAGPVGVAVNPIRSRVYVTNSSHGSVSVIDTANHDIVKVKDPDSGVMKSYIYAGIGQKPWGIAVSPRGDRVYVANSGSTTVSVIDAASNKVIKVIDNEIIVNKVARKLKPYGIAVNPKLPEIYVTNSDDHSVSVINTDNYAVNLVNIHGLPFSKPYGIAVDLEGNYVYVTNQSAVPGSVSVFDARDDTVYRRVDVGVEPVGLAVNPANDMVYVVNNKDHTVSAINTTNYTVTTFDSRGGLPNYIAFNSEGTLAYVTNFGSGDVSVIDTVSNNIIDVAPDNNAASTINTSRNPYTFGNFVGPAISSSPAVVEFYNTNLDHYFITADANEAAMIDGGSAGAGWSRTGNTFKSGGGASVCRFYGSQSPGPNSHFYTVDSVECQGLKDQQIPEGDSRKLTDKSWNFENMDFVSTAPTNGACPTGTTPVYRAYNNGFARGIDSNHRITSSLAAIQEVVKFGWSDEGVAMCSPY